jgi:hypothetical protein
MGFSILSLIHASLSVFLVKNCCTSSFWIIQSSMLSIVWNSVLEISCQVLAMSS